MFLKAISTANNSQAIPLKISTRFVPIILALVGLSILQDLIYSRLQDTGFYLSESLLYNTIWLYCIPFLFLIKKFFINNVFSNSKSKLIILVVLALACSLVHVFVFASIFCLVSTLSYETPHRFSTMLNGALSKQLYILFLVYILTPIVFRFWTERKIIDQKSETRKIMVSKGLRKVSLAIDEIICLTTDKPYAVIITKDQKFYDSRSLKNLHQILDANLFRRVHKSSIVNRNEIVELNSRKNGDYDAVLSNGTSVRLSRHLKKNWEDLLLH